MLLQRKKDEAILPSFTELFLCCCCVCVCVCVGTGIGCILFFYVLFLWRNHWFFHFQDGPKQCVRDAGFLWLARFFEKKRKEKSSRRWKNVSARVHSKEDLEISFFFLVSFYSVCLCGIIREKKKRLHLWSKKSSTEWNHFSKIVKKNVVLFFLKKRKWFSISKKKNNRRIANEIEWGGRGLPLFKKKKNTFLALGTALFFCLFFF